MAPDTYTWWRHRRRHSYTALWAAVLETAALVLAWINGGDSTATIRWMAIGY